MIPDYVKYALGVAWVLWCSMWVLEVAFLIDRWHWWRKTRGSVHAPLDVSLLAGLEPGDMAPCTTIYIPEEVYIPEEERPYGDV